MYSGFCVCFPFSKKTTNSLVVIDDNNDDDDQWFFWIKKFTSRVCGGGGLSRIFLQLTNHTAHTNHSFLENRPPVYYAVIFFFFGFGSIPGFLLLLLSVLVFFRLLVLFVCWLFVCLIWFDWISMLVVFFILFSFVCSVRSFFSKKFYRNFTGKSSSF